MQRTLLGLFAVASAALGVGALLAANLVVGPQAEARPLVAEFVDVGTDAPAEAEAEAAAAVAIDAPPEPVAAEVRARAVSAGTAMPRAPRNRVAPRSTEDASPAAPAPSTVVVYFAKERATLGPRSRAVLRDVSETLRRGNLRLEIHGHADRGGEEAMNDRLSSRRAARVFDYLVALGTDRQLLQVEAFGARLPALRAHTERARRKNRRVELHWRPR